MTVVNICSLTGSELVTSHGEKGHSMIHMLLHTVLCTLPVPSCALKCITCCIKKPLFIHSFGQATCNSSIHFLITCPEQKERNDNPGASCYPLLLSVDIYSEGTVCAYYSLAPRPVDRLQR